MPICSSQGQISSGRAWMVTARVALNVGCLTTASPGMARATSSSVAPQRSCQGRIKRRYAPNATAPRAATPIPIFLNITGCSLVKVTPKRNLRQHDASDSASSFPSSICRHFVRQTDYFSVRNTTSRSHCHHSRRLHHHNCSRSWMLHHTTSLSKDRPLLEDLQPFDI